MQSIVFSAVSPILFGMMITVSLYILYRGHNEPGGGFVGGLVAASGFAIIALAKGVHTARRWLGLDPTVLLGIGVLCALASGLPGLVLDGSFLSHQWAAVAGLAVGTTLVFDLGVYLVVVGGVLSLVVRFYEGD